MTMALTGCLTDTLWVSRYGRSCSRCWIESVISEHDPDCSTPRPGGLVKSLSLG